MRHFFFGKALLGVLALGLLAGCETYERVAEYMGSDNASKCPDVAVLANAAMLPAFDPRKVNDPTTIVYSVSMTKAKLTCSARQKKNRADSSITVTFTARRPTGGPYARYRVPYFVAATINGHILDKKTHWQEFAFEQGDAVTTFEADIDDLITQASRRRRPTDYHFIVGFQLTRAQLEYIKETGQYAP